MWGSSAINTDQKAEQYLAETPDELIKGVKDVMTAMKYMQNADVSSVLVAQKNRIAQRLRALDEVEMPRFQKHTLDRASSTEKNWHKWTSRGLANEWDTWMRTRAVKAKAKAVDYIDTWLPRLKTKAEYEWNADLSRLEQRVANGEDLSPEETELGERLTELISKVVALNAEWERYKPISWTNPF